MHLALATIALLAASFGILSKGSAHEVEEGAWKPGITVGGSSSGVTFSKREARYMKIGDLVMLWAFLVLSNKGSGRGEVLITGLPYRSSSLGVNFFCVLHVDDAPGIIDAPYLLIGANEDVAYPRHINKGNSDNLTDRDIDDDTQFGFQCTYRTGS